MGFFANRRMRKIEESMEFWDRARASHGPLRIGDDYVQELEARTQELLDQGAFMPPFWAQVGIDLANEADLDHEEEHSAFTDTVVTGYALRLAEAATGRARPAPADIGVRLTQAGDCDRPAVARRTVVDVAAGRIPEIFSADEKAWDDFEHWSRRTNVKRSADRRQARFDAAGIRMKAVGPRIDYERALTYGYAICCCQEVAGFAEVASVALTEGMLDDPGLGQAEDDANDATRPTEPLPDDPRAIVDDLLSRTEDVFVTLGAPGRVGVAVTGALLASMGVPEDHPQYGVAAGAALFGYALRVAQSAGCALPEQTRNRIADNLVFGADGAVNHEALANDDGGSLIAVLEQAAAMADDLDELLALIAVRREVWERFSPLAAEALTWNLQRHGVKRRHIPPPDGIENLIRLGVATRVIDEAAGEEPLLKPAS
jgi:hypothetical protein